MSKQPYHKQAKVWTAELQNRFETMYSVHKQPLGEIAKQLNVSIGSLENRIKKLGMRRTPDE